MMVCPLFVSRGCAKIHTPCLEVFHLTKASKKVKVYVLKNAVDWLL